MKREIKFRGKVKRHDPMTNPENGWVEGYYFQDLTQGEMLSYIFQPPCSWEVIPDTVGQFTGLLDKNGKEIYEGDIVKTKHFGKDLKSGNHFVNVSAEDVFEIKYINAQFMFNNEARWFYLHRNTPCEIIGNIHDNPEL